MKVYRADVVQDVPDERIDWEYGLRPVGVPEICFHLERLETGAREMYLVFYNADKKDAPCDVRMLLKVELDCVFSEVFLPAGAAIWARSQCEDPGEALHRGWENILADNCQVEIGTKPEYPKIVEIHVTMMTGDVTVAEVDKAEFVDSLNSA
ncbi:hypothetical protein C4564_00220 [Candidatus Microgenomates bacterium]|nr:MAG: hypothetical protein C4564_00220 [Candidatus Microgenomates bacterium]